MQSRQAFFQRVSSSLIVPLTFLPLAAILLAIGTQLGIGPVESAGLALVKVWLPLFYAVGISIGFTESDGMAALSVAAGFFVMTSVAEAVAGDPTLNVGVLGGLVAGALFTWLYNRVKGVALPEYLALFSGKRMGPLVTTVAGVALGYLFGAAWPPIHGAIVTLGEWMYGAGGAGVFAYGASLRLLIPTGLHHILMQLMDTQIGGWVDPATGKLVAGEYVRFLAGDPAAGRILSGFFLTLGFGPVGAALAITREAKPSQRRRVAGLMTTGALTAALLGITEPVEFAFLFASPLLFGVHVILSGLASLLAWLLEIHLGGYALPMILINWHRQQNGLLLLPLGIAWAGVYYLTFRAIIRWRRPPILGQVEEEAPADVRPAEAGDEGRAVLAALGGAGNIVSLDACMTRLRLVLREPGHLDEAALKRHGASAILRPGGGDVQVVVGARAGEVAGLVRTAMGPAPSRGAATVVTLVSPLTGRVVPLAEVPDPVFSGKLAGDGVAVAVTDGTVVAPAAGEVVHVFPGGHALGLLTPEGLELLVHIGIDTVALKGEGFEILVKEGDRVAPGMPIGRCDPAAIARHGKSPVSPVLVTNPDVAARITPLATGHVAAGEPLLRVLLEQKGR